MSRKSDPQLPLDEEDPPPPISAPRGSVGGLSLRASDDVRDPKMAGFSWEESL